jgi:hypothetical protein
MKLPWTRESKPAMADVEGISSVLAAALGNEGPVLHEINSPLIHLDVLVFNPTAQRDTYVLVTCGMSALPMDAPDGEGRFLELCIELPSHWPFTPEAFKDERNYWPIRLLKELGRHPHVHHTWLGAGHTVANGDPPKAYAGNTRFCCAILVPPVSLPEAARELPLPRSARPKPGETARLLQIAPIHRNEMEYKLKNGSSALMERLVIALDGMGLQIEVERRDCCAADAQVQ